MGAPSNKNSITRIQGLDLARALAVFGMVAVNYKIVMGASQAGPVWLVRLAGLLDGRAAALFVILAGVGISLMASGGHNIAETRARILRRAGFLFVVGLAYTPIWPADILHFYGLYFVVAAFFLASSERRLLAGAAFFSLGFVALLLVFDYEAGWVWETLTYTDLWTPNGMLRHLIFNGFHPLFPWAAFLLFGIWLGRQELGQNGFRGRLLWGGLAVTFTVEAAMWGLRGAGWGRELAQLLATGPIPPMPWYLLSAGGTATAVLSISLNLADRFRGAAGMEALLATGQAALTLYVAHVVLGMGVLEALGLLKDQSLGFALTAAGIFCLLGLAFASGWRKRFRRGPLETLMRKLTG